VQSAMAMIVFLSKGAFDSEWVRLEVEHAVQHRKPIIFVHESHSQHPGYMDVGEIKAKAPSHLQVLFEGVRSIPYRRHSRQVKEMTQHIVALMHSPLPAEVYAESERLCNAARSSL